MLGVERDREGLAFGPRWRSGYAPSVSGSSSLAAVAGSLSLRWSRVSA